MKKSPCLACDTRFRQNLLKRHSVSCTASQSGQSLVEFVLIVPCFFVILAGMMGFFYLQNRHFSDTQSQFALSLSPYLFSNEERIAGEWEGAPRASSTALSSTLHYSLNPSLGVNSSLDKKEGVFLDKKRVTQASTSQCRQENTFGMATVVQKNYEFTTCASQNGYERQGFVFQKLLIPFKLSVFKAQGSSVFYPEEHFAWESRSRLPAVAVQSFLLSAGQPSFSKNVASFLYPVDESTLNGHCFMEPFSPLCEETSYASKIDRAARDGANLQLASCYAEMAAQCAPTGLALPVCLAKGVFEISQVLKFGFPATSCPVLNQLTRAHFLSVKAKSLTAAAFNFSKEGIHRKKVGL